MTSALKNSNRMAIDNALRNHSLDALLDLSSGVLKSYGARAGYPGITVPSGFDEYGDPTGLYFFAPPGAKRLFCLSPTRLNKR